MIETTNILNELMRHEQRSLCARLLESTPFVSQLAMEELALVQRMAATARRHAEWVAEAILTRGGVPGPRCEDVRSGDLHFQDLRNLLPRLAEDRRLLIKKCTLAQERIRGDVDANALIGRIAENHRRELETLPIPEGLSADRTA